MTSSPPEPPVGSGGPPPAPQPATPPPPQAPQWSAPPPGQPAPTASTGGGLASVKPMDWGIMAAGLLAFIFSFMSFYTGTAKASQGGQSVSRTASENAWHGFFGWFAVALALIAAIRLAVHIFAPAIRMAVPVRLIVLGGFGLATICMIIAGFVTPGTASAADIRAAEAAGVHVSISYARGVGFYLALIVILAGTVLAYLRLRETGGTLPWEKNRT